MCIDFKISVYSEGIFLATVSVYATWDTPIGVNAFGARAQHTPFGVNY